MTWSQVIWQRIQSDREHFARIKEIHRVEGLFDALLNLNRQQPECALHVGPLEHADPVLAGACPAQCERGTK
jgi:hypothetical protein